MRRKFGATDYLAELNIVSFFVIIFQQRENNNIKLIKLNKKIRDGTAYECDMATMICNAKSSTTKGDISDVTISHLSPCRVNRNTLDMTKLEVIASFCYLRRYIEYELENTAIERKESDDGRITFSFKTFD